MTKILILLICIAALHLDLSTSTAIECEYYLLDFNIEDRVYSCYVSKDPKITSLEHAAETSIHGEHFNPSRSSDSVNGFKIVSQTINYFPTGLQTYFNNLKFFQITRSGLKEVHQDDLRHFPKLVELLLYKNSIKVLEKGLFDFNPDLEWVELDSNEIISIEPSIFDNLSKLRGLFLETNRCINRSARNSTEVVEQVIKDVKTQCIEQA